MDYFLWVPERIAQLRLQKGISARDMSLSLGQSESYINKIENRRTLPSMAGFLYICEYFGITLTPTQACHILQVVQDLGETAGPLKK